MSLIPPFLSTGEKDDAVVVGRGDGSAGLGLFSGGVFGSDRLKQGNYTIRYVLYL